MVMPGWLDSERYFYYALEGVECNDDKGKQSRLGMATFYPETIQVLPTATRNRVSRRYGG